MGKLMKLYLISQDLVNGYNVYDSAVVSAIDEDDARGIHPSLNKNLRKYGISDTAIDNASWGVHLRRTWVDFSDISSITVEYLGETNKARGVILASFNAG
jgi:hypothetical protein